MNGDKKSSPDSDVALELLRFAGPRHSVPKDAAERVKKNVEEHWRRRTASRRRLAWYTLAASISVVALVTAFWVLTRSSSDNLPGSPIATADVVRGDVRWSTGEETLPLPLGVQVTLGAAVVTGSDGRVSLRLANGQSLRVDLSSHIQFDSRNQVTLHRGAIYVDSENLAQVNGLVVATAAARIVEVGTQFEVRVADGVLRVRVREGMVNIFQNSNTHSVNAGGQFLLDAEGNVAIDSVSPTDPDWSWHIDVAPAFMLEGASTFGFLKWVSRETGLRLDWPDSSLEARSKTMTLHGDIAESRPIEALDLVLPTCGLTHRIEDGHVIVESLSH